MATYTGGDLEYLHARNGLGELITALFTFRKLRSVSQVRCLRRDKLTEDPTQIPAVEIQMRTVQFEGVRDIHEKLTELEEKGIS